MNIQRDPFQSAGVYTDIHNLNNIKTQAKEDESGALKEVARQFESMFVSMMMKSMRDANKVFEEGNFLKSNESEFYQQMFDSQLALSLSQGEGIGLAESLYRQMSANYGIDQNVDIPPGAKTSIQDYPRTERAQRAVRMIDAMVEIDRLVGTQNTAPETAAPAANVVNSHWESILASAEQKLANEERSASPAVIPQVNLPTTFESPEAFVSALFPIAQKVQDDTGLDARFMLAQSALETGWGKHMITGDAAEPSYNLFGIKADHRWQGEQVNIVTTEYRDNTAMKERAAFRAYDNYEQSFRDYVAFLKENPRYKEATQLFSQPADLAVELQNAGYATDPRYSEKIQRIFNSDLLKSAIKNHQG